MKLHLVALSLLLSLSLPAFAAVDLNTASQAELESINGVGPSKAQAIIEYRKKNGPFKTVDDLDKVPGFGAKTVDAVRKQVSVGNAKTAAGSKVDSKSK